MEIGILVMWLWGRDIFYNKNEFGSIEYILNFRDFK